MEVENPKVVWVDWLWGKDGVVMQCAIVDGKHKTRLVDPKTGEVIEQKVKLK